MDQRLRILVTVWLMTTTQFTLLAGSAEAVRAMPVTLLVLHAILRGIDDSSSH